jgi:hypothetical protein
VQQQPKKNETFSIFIVFFGKFPLPSKGKTKEEDK